MRTALWMGLLAFGLHAADAAATPKVRLNDTGMLKCADSQGTFTWTCTGTGEDGAYGRDVTQPAERDGRMGFSFTKMCNSGELAGTGTCTAQAAIGVGADDWGCTQDNVTGLVWEEKNTSRGLHSHDDSYLVGEVAGFVKSVNAAGLCGASDWREPAPAELQGLVNYIVTYGPMIDLNWFPNTYAEGFWATGHEHWVVDFGDGYFHVSTDSYYDRYLARVVRTGTAPPAKRFKLQDAEVTDTRTQLVWRRCVEGQAWTGTTCAGMASAYAWSDALAHALAEAAATGQGWRLPNLKELTSLVDYSLATSPLIDATAFPATPKTASWTSTPYQGTSTPQFQAPPGVFGVDFSVGSFGAYPFPVVATEPIRLVRDAGH